MRRITMTINNNITFKEGVEEYLQDCRARNLREGTLIHYRNSMKTIYKFIKEDDIIADMNKHTFDKFIIDCKAKLNVNDISLYTYARDFKTLLRFFMKSGYIEPFEIVLPKKDKKAIECYTDDEIKKLLKKPDVKKCKFVEFRNWVIVNFLLSTGIRLNSLINIKIKDLDFDNNIVYINVTKNRKPLILPLNGTIVKILKEYLRVRQYNSSDEWLFCSVFGEKFDKEAISPSLRKYNRKRGVTTTGIHRYRHTFAKKWITSGGNPAVLQKILGHSSLDITENYINLLVEDLHREMEEFNILEQFASQHIKMNFK